jgi:hypothetical protein
MWGCYAERPRVRASRGRGLDMPLCHVGCVEACNRRLAALSGAPKSPPLTVPARETLHPTGDVYSLDTGLPPRPPPDPPTPPPHPHRPHPSAPKKTNRANIDRIPGSRTPHCRPHATILSIIDPRGCTLSITHISLKIRNRTKSNQQNLKSETEHRHRSIDTHNVATKLTAA